MTNSPAGLRIDIVSDAICPWCYIGKRQLERALATLAQEGLHFSVHWNPFQLNPDMPKEGRDRAAYRALEVRQRREGARDGRARDRSGGQCRPAPSALDLMTRTPNTLDAHRLIWLAGHKGVQDAVMEAVFMAYFTQGRDIGDRDVLAECAAEAGMDRARSPISSPAMSRQQEMLRRGPRRARGRRERRAVVLPGRLRPLFRRDAGRDDGRGPAQGPRDPAPTRGLKRRFEGFAALNPSYATAITTAILVGSVERVAKSIASARSPQL